MQAAPFAALFCLAVAAGAPIRATPPPFLLQDRIVRLDPFQASPLRVNPPTLRWPAAAGAISYRIELARDAAFASPRVEIARDPFLRLLDPLEPGRWYWRCRAETPRPGPWIGSASFTIAAELPRWPLPAWASLLQQVPASHPRVYLRADEIPRVRENARRLAPTFLPWKESIRRELESPFSLSSYEERARQAAGGDPDQAKKILIWEAKAAGRDASAPAADGAWIWLATGDRWFLDAARGRALAAAALDPQGFVSARNSDFGNSYIVGSLGVVYDLLHDELSPDDRARLRAAIVARARPLFREMAGASQELMRPHNWQENYLGALTGALAIYGEDPHAKEWAALGLKTFVALYPWFGGDDGGSQEGTRYYCATELASSLDTLDLFRSSFGLRLDQGNPWFRANPYFLIYSFPPGSPLAKLGDNNVGENPGDADDRPTPGGRIRLAAERMAELYGNGYAAAYADRLPTDTDGLTIGEYLRWSNPPHTAPASLSSLPAARLFRDIGAVYTHSDYEHPDDNVRLVFHCDPYGAQGHAHADQNSFHLIAYNEDLLLDSGYYTPVGDPHRQEWSIQTKAHNSILVDGVGQIYGGTKGYGEITHFEQSSSWVYMVGAAATAYPAGLLQRFDRHIVWLKGRTVQTYVIVDDLESGAGARRRFDWLLHAANRMKYDEAAKRVEVAGNQGEARITFLAPAELSFHQDDRFDAPAVYWRNGKDIPLPNQWHLKATPPATNRTRFVAVIQVTKPGVPKPAPRLEGASVEAAGWRLLLPSPGGLIRIERATGSDPSAPEPRDPPDSLGRR